MNHNSRDVRFEQENEGRSRSGTLSVSRPKREASMPQRKPFVAKGHDAILKGLQDTGAYITITPMSDGVSRRGQMVARDKYTITIKTDEGRIITYYKHAIESFEPDMVH